MDEIKLQLCKQFISLLFNKKSVRGIEVNLFFKLAEEVGLYTPNTYGTPMADSSSRLQKVAK